MGAQGYHTNVPPAAAKNPPAHGLKTTRHDTNVTQPSPKKLKTNPLCAGTNRKTQAMAHRCPHRCHNSPLARLTAPVPPDGGICCAPGVADSPPKGGGRGLPSPERASGGRPYRHEKHKCNITQQKAPGFSRGRCRARRKRAERERSREQCRGQWGGVPHHGHGA